jgi:tRNA(Arg) A34 adenosine deaminase TadA
MTSTAFQETLWKVAEIAKRAGEHGTFGVAGALIDYNGNILSLARNKVIRGPEIDTTQHVEIQLIQWCKEHRENKGIRNNETLTIACSLEPCMMCAGAILREGFKCIALAEDFDAGVGVKQGFKALPAPLRDQAQKSIFLADLLSDNVNSKNLPAFARATVPEAIITKAGDAFAASLGHIRKTVSRKSSQRPPRGPNAPAPGTIRIVGEGGLTAVAANKRPAEKRLHPALFRAIKTFNRRRKRLDRSAMRFVLNDAFSDEIDFVISIGAIGSFYESPAPRESIVFVNVKPETVHQYREWLADFPIFYTQHVGLTIGLATTHEGRSGFDDPPNRHLSGVLTV